MKRIMIDKDRCNGCLNCSLACMAEHNPAGKSIYVLNLTDIRNESRNFIALDRSGKPTPIFCRHCGEPECVIACMSGAMSRDPATGRVTYDPEQCAACFMCVLSCPFGVLKADAAERKVIIKCDFCGERETPRCVENCPNRAIYVIEVSEE
jgi:carbon-monoxide dehydrogenase iron sulfur subunit